MRKIQQDELASNGKTLNKFGFRNGDTFEGEFWKGMRHGSGRHKVADDSEAYYIGRFVRNLKHGTGRYSRKKYD